MDLDINVKTEEDCLNELMKLRQKQNNIAENIKRGEVLVIESQRKIKNLKGLHLMGEIATKMLLLRIESLK